MGSRGAACVMYSSYLYLPRVPATGIAVRAGRRPCAVACRSPVSSGCGPISTGNRHLSNSDNENGPVKFVPLLFGPVMGKYKGAVHGLGTACFGELSARFNGVWTFIARNHVASYVGRYDDESPKFLSVDCWFLFFLLRTGHLVTEPAIVTSNKTQETND